MEKIKVLIADDHRVVREGLAAILKTKEDIQVIGEAQDGIEAVEKARALLPDVILMDVSMPRMGGVEATRQIKREFPHIGIVALTMPPSETNYMGVMLTGDQPACKAAATAFQNKVLEVASNPLNY